MFKPEFIENLKNEILLNKNKKLGEIKFIKSEEKIVSGIESDNMKEINLIFYFSTFGTSKSFLSIWFDRSFDLFYPNGKKDKKRVAEIMQEIFNILHESGEKAGFTDITEKFYPEIPEWEYFSFPIIWLFMKTKDRKISPWVFSVSPRAFYQPKKIFPYRDIFKLKLSREGRLYPNILCISLQEPEQDCLEREKVRFELTKARCMLSW